MVEDLAAKPPPEGFSLSRSRGPYSTHNGPWYDRIDGDRFERGFWVLERHCNSFGLVHGGLICSFLDALLAGQSYRVAGRMGVTIDLHTHFLAMAHAGDWVQGDAKVTRHAGDLVFVEGRAFVKDRDIAHGHAIFKLMNRSRPA